MLRLFAYTALALLLLALTTPMLRAQALLEPPFNLRWGDTPEKLIDWAARHSMDLTISIPGDQPGLRRVRAQPKTGFLPDSQAGAVEGHFLAGRLYEVTVHYFDDKASAEIITARFEAVRTRITSEQGPLLTNQQHRTLEDQFVTRTQSFHREPVRGLFLLLAFTEVEDLLRKKRDARFSVIYRNENLKKELSGVSR